MGRLRGELLERAENFAHGILDAVEVASAAPERISFRMLDQITASGTSVGANLYEADEALSLADFRKTLGIVVKELRETRFWLRLMAKRDWIPPAMAIPLQAEAEELRRIVGAILSKTGPLPPGGRISA